MGRGITTKPQPQAQVDVPMVELPSEPRVRKNGAGPECPNCNGTDTFVQSGGPRVHPEFLEVRFRHYRCGRCEHRFKLPK